MLPTVTFVTVVGYAGLVDLRTRRIPNWLTLTGVVCALIFRAIDGLEPLLHGVAGAGAAFAVAILLFSIGALGGGDGKLLVTVGAFLGYGQLVGALLLIGVLGGFLGVIVAIRRGIVLPSVLHATGMMRRWLTLGRSGESRSLSSPGAIAVPYGVAIAVGSIAWWFWEGPFL